MGLVGLEEELEVLEAGGWIRRIRIGGKGFVGLEGEVVELEGGREREPFVRLFIRPFYLSFVGSFFGSFILLFLRSFVPSFLRSFVLSFVPRAQKASKRRNGARLG